MERLATGLAVGALAAFVAMDLNLPSVVSFWGDRSVLIPAAAVVGAVLWLTPLRRLVGITAALLLLLWTVVAFTPLTAILANGLVRRDPVEAADAVFVFGSDIQDDGDPSSDAMSRLLKGVELVAEGRARYLLVSELPPPAGPHLPIARAWLSTFARRGEAISVGRIRNTRDEAVAVARVFQERGWSRVLAVTSPTHTRRAAAALEKQGLVVVSVPAVETKFDLETLGWPGDRRAAFPTLLHERIGMIVYKRRGWV
jgi:uncharacterized SAM-binding protein YcdF (DUF218 family)